MPSASPADGAAWEPFESRGRPFLRATLPGSRPGEAAFAVAREVAGRYRVGGAFAAGPLGVLLRAVDGRTGRVVLLKALRGYEGAEGAPADGVRRLRHQLQAERRLLVRLRNAGCAAVAHPDDYAYDRNPALEAFGPALDEALIATEPYLVLPLLPGATLEAVLESEYPGGLDEPTALALIRPVVEALAILHEPWRLRGGSTWHCVYQDLKPANILVGPDGRPTLLDFGGCQVVVDGVPVLEGGCTPGYAAPECEGPGPARVLLACADVYGIGSTLHHMLTGVDPRDRLARRRGRPGSHLDPADLPPSVSPGLRELVARCLAPRPSGRHADARRVALALAELDQP